MTTSEPKYMNGHGIMRRTEELNSRLWDAVPAGILGLTVATCGAAGLSVSLSTGHLLGLALSVVAIGLGTWVASFWFVAEAAVKKHTEAMLAETAKRGKGWADGT